MSAYLTVRTLPLALAGFSCYRAGCVRGSPPCHREGAIAKLMAHSVRAQSTAHEREVPHLQGFSSTATGLRSGLARRTPCPAPESEALVRPRYSIPAPTRLTRVRAPPPWPCRPPPAPRRTVGQLALRAACDRR